MKPQVLAETLDEANGKFLEYDPPLGKADAWAQN